MPPRQARRTLGDARFQLTQASSVNVVLLSWRYLGQPIDRAQCHTHLRHGESSKQQNGSRGTHSVQGVGDRARQCGERVGRCCVDREA